MIVCPLKDIGRYASVIPHLQEAQDFLSKLQDLTPAEYPLPHGKVKIQQGTTHILDNTKIEAHRKYLDIQVVLQGQEMFGWAPLDTVQEIVPFDKDKDLGFYTGETIPVMVTAGNCYVLYPEDGHAPCSHLDTPTDYVKALVKLEL